jgi:hypothetical protein
VGLSRYIGGMVLKALTEKRVLIRIDRAEIRDLVKRGRRLHAHTKRIRGGRRLYRGPDERTRGLRFRMNPALCDRDRRLLR